MKRRDFLQGAVGAGASLHMGLLFSIASADDPEGDGDDSNPSSPDKMSNRK